MALGLPFIDIFFKKLKAQIYDDFVDRINYFVTTMLLLFFAIMVSAKQYFGSPIQCWVPAQFKGGWEQYAEDYCFIENTYHLRIDKPIPIEEERRKMTEIGYYQWVPIVLAVQAIMFYLPNVVWKMMLHQSGVDLKTILTQAKDASHKNSEEKSKRVEELALYIDDALKMNCRPRVKTGFCCLQFGNNLGSYISCTYLFVKVLYIVNIFLQFWIMNAFLGTNYDFFGLQIFTDLLSGRSWDFSGHFPRVTLCDFDIRILGNLQPHTVQCVLMINMYNEKIYLLLWFWFLAVGVMTILNLLWWCWDMMLPNNRQRVAKRHLKVARAIDFQLSDSHVEDGKTRIHLPGDAADQTYDFVSYYLKPDGILILKFLKNHAGDMVTSNLAKALFMTWYDNRRKYYPQGKHMSNGTQHHVRMLQPPDYESDTTKSTSPGDEDGFHENLYDPKKPPHHLRTPTSALSGPGDIAPLLGGNGVLPTAPPPGLYGQAPPIPPKPKIDDVDAL